MYRMSPLLLLALIDVVRSATQIVGYSPTDGTGITYENGLPKTIPISFDTDFNVDQSSKAVGSTYVEWTLTENSGNSLYDAINQDNHLTFDSTAAGSGRVATFTLNPSGNTPGIGSNVVVTLEVTLKYVNTASLALVMHSRTFTVTLAIVGAENSHRFASSSSISTNAFAPPSSDQEKDSLVATPLPPGLVLHQSGGPVAFPNPIILVVDALDSAYNLWFDSTAPVEIRDGAQVTDTLLYKWPTSLVSATVTSETPGTHLLSITLSSVPVSLYNKEAIFVFLTVKFRDTVGDRRALKGLDRMEIRYDVVSKVQVECFTEGEGDFLEVWK